MRSSSVCGTPLPRYKSRTTVAICHVRCYDAVLVAATIGSDDLEAQSVRYCRPVWPAGVLLAPPLYWPTEELQLEPIHHERLIRYWRSSFEYMQNRATR
jgi:hypothetical protein